MNSCPNLKHLPVLGEALKHLKKPRLKYRENGQRHNESRPLRRTIQGVRQGNPETETPASG